MIDILRSSREPPLRRPLTPLAFAKNIFLGRAQRTKLGLKSTLVNGNTARASAMPWFWRRSGEECLAMAASTIRQLGSASFGAYSRTTAAIAIAACATPASLAELLVV